MRYPARRLTIFVKRHLAAGCLALLVAMLPAASLAHPPSSDDAYLDGLLGRWTMSGTLGGKPVAYDAQGERVLDGAWVRLHLVDAAQPPQYRADVFIDYDAKEHDFIAHWLDQFGAAGARVVATGHRDGERLVLVFPYSDGAFRDTFRRIGQGGGWTLLIEAQGKNGTWSVFASYKLLRRRKK